MTILVAYEGVLQVDGKEQPIIDGFRLVQSLALSNRIVLMTRGTTARVEHQLRTERLQDSIAETIDNTVALEPLPLWERQIEVARAKWPVAMMLTGDPQVAQYTVERGIVTLFFAHPGFSKPALRPEQGNRTWEQLTDELDRRWS